MKKFLLAVSLLIPVLVYADSSRVIEYFGIPSDGDVPIYSSSQKLWIPGPQSGGGGGSSITEYNEGDTDSSITGIAILWEDTSDTLRVPSMSKPLPIQAGSGATFACTQSGTWDEVGINDSGNSITVDGTVTANLGTLNGAATSAKQDTIIGHVDDVETTLTSIDGKDFATETTLAALDAKVTAVDTGNVTVSASALPTGAATAANQTTIIGHVDGIEGILTTIDTDTGNIATSASSIDTKLSSQATAAKQDTIIGHVDGIETLIGTTNSTLTTIDGRVDGIEGLLGTSNTNTGATTTALQIIDDWDESDRAKVNIIVGQAGITAGAGSVAANTPRITHASDDPVTTALQIIDNFISGSRGLVTEDNSAAIAASASVLDDWDESDRAKVNLIAGQAGIAGGTGVDGATVPRVTLATNVGLPPGTNNIGDVDVLTLPNASSATTTSVADSNSSQQLVASNASRKGLIVINDSTESLYLKYGTTASTTDFTWLLRPQDSWYMPGAIYTGRIDGIWSANASGSARITEY